MAKQWKNEDIIYPEDAQRWENGIENAQQNNTQIETNLKNHTDNRLNPHNVTAAQTGAYTKAEADIKDAAILSGAKAYTDLHSVKKDNPHGVTAGQIGTYTKAEVDERDASTLSAAKSYSDTKKTETTTYTDQKVATAKSEIQSGSVASANKLTTARKIAGIDFDGTKDISIPANNVGAYTKTETDSKIAATKTDIVSGNVASATKLSTARTISLSGAVAGSASFDGSSNITITTSSNIAIAKFSANDVLAGSKGSFTEAFWQYRREGNRVEFFARLNFSATASTTNMVDVHSIPVGFRLSTEFSDTMWNAPLSVSVVGNPSNHEMNGVAERQATNLIRVGSSTSGNKYVYGTWFTDDPFPVG